MDAQDRPDRSSRGEEIRRELEESRERYRILVETLPHGIQELDLQGVLRFTNPAHDRMFGYPRGAMEGMRVSDLLFREEEREGMEGLFRRMGRDRPEPRPLVFLDRRADGSPLWVEVVWDYMKDPDGELTGFVAVVTDISERVRQEEALRGASLHDPLTGLPNRALFFERLTGGIRECRRRGQFLGLVYLDLDDFKGVNDRLGHLAGDEVLVEVARRLSRIARQGDTVARLGGDEFVLVRPFLDSPTAMAGVSRRVHGVLRSPLTLRGGRSVEVGCSLGQAVWPRDGRREDDLLRVADNRMYRSKRRRRRVVPEEGG